VRGNGNIIQELEAAFRGAGWNAIKGWVRRRTVWWWGRGAECGVAGKLEGRVAAARGVCNEYGPTETVVGCSVRRIRDDSELESLQERGGSVPIGRPIWNTRLYVVGESGQLQPPHSVGELCIGGAGWGGGI